MPAPVIVTIRAGVQFTPAAGASFRRVEAELGRRADVNSSYRDYNKQLKMFNDWNAYVAGKGPHPGHSRALHPDYSVHCLGLALDSDDWVTPGFNELMARHGWIRTAAKDPSEQHHYEYQWWRDQHRGDFAGHDLIPIKEEDPMILVYVYPTGDTGVKGVIGTINRAFKTPAEREHFLNIWGTPDAPKLGAKIYTLVTEPQFVSDVLRIHTGSDVAAVNVPALAAALGPLLPKAAGMNEAALVSALTKALEPQFDAIHANIDDQPTEFKVIPN